MRNERGPRKTGRSGTTGYKGKSSSGDSKKPGGRRSGSGPKKYSKDTKEFGDKKSFDKATSPKKYGAKSIFKQSGAPGTGFKKEGEEKRNSKSSFGKPYKKSFSSKSPYKKKFDANNDSTEKEERKPYSQKPLSAKNNFSSKGPYKKKFEDKDHSEKPDRESKFEKKPFGANKFKKTGAPGDKKFPKNPGSYAEYKKKGSGNNFTERKEYKRKTGIKTYTDKNDPDKTYTKETEITRNKNASKSFVKKKVYQKTEEKESDGLIRLNKFIANAGICSRREADTFIQTGVVSVNGVIITELGYKVKPDDKVLFGGKPIIGEKPVYILLNKPKDYITTSKDPQNRKTVLDLIIGVKERVFPIGRLDRKTTGVLLLTNDGPLAEKLMHPRKGVTKIYHVELDYRFSAPDMEKMRTGIELEDGLFKPDVVDYAEGMDKHHVGIEIHSGANHIVRRLFESMDYKVIKLDRVVYAGLTKKGLTRGKWRFLTDSELHMLRMM